MGKKKPKVNMDMVRKDCYKYDVKKKACIALEALFCGVEGESECNFYKSTKSVPIQGKAISCKFCGTPFIPAKHSGYIPKYCSQSCRDKARYSKKVLPGGGKFRDGKEMEE